MKKSELREFLNKQNVPFSLALHKLNEFVLEPINKAIIANYMITELKKNKSAKTKDIFSLFYSATRSLVSQTRICNNVFAEQSLLRSVFISSQFQNIIIALAKQGYRLLPVEGAAGDKKPELTKEQRLKKQAAIMREAKAKRRAERLAKENHVLQPKEKGVETAQNTQEKSVETAQNTQEKRFTKEQLEQINLLRNLKIK